jgi:excisionase family DNA binding protein
MSKMITVKELSALLRVPISTVHQWTHKKQIPFYRIGRYCLFKDDEITQWLEAKKHGGNQ